MKKKRQQKIHDFILTNRLLRRANIFLYQSVFPILLKSFLIFLTLLLLIFGALKLFKPDLLTKIYQKSSFYFFHHLNLDNYDFNQINIFGNSRISKEEIMAIVDDVQKKVVRNKTDDYQPMIQQLVVELKEQLLWANKVVVTRSMPNVLNISITEYEPFAIWYHEGRKFVIDKDGNAIPLENTDEFKHFVILSGKGANIHAKSLFNIFSTDSNLSANIYSATWIGDRRWDVRFENGLLVKLPESNISNAWQHLIRIYNMPGSVSGLKIIDLRVKDKIYLEYNNDSMMKEIKNL